MAGPAQPPFYVPRGDPPPPWVGIPIRSNTLSLLTGGGNPVSNEWLARYIYVPPSDWTWPGIITGDVVFQLTVGGRPFKKLWRWDNFPDPVWQGEPQPTNIGTFPVAQAPFSTERFTQFTYVTDAFWVGIPTAVPDGLTGIIPEGVIWFPDPIYEQPWQWDPPYNNNLLTPTTVTPFANEWFAQSKYVAPPDWLGAPVGAPFEILGGKVTTRQWRWDHLPDQFWQGTPLARNAQIRSVTTLFVLPSYAQSYYVPDTEWEWSGRTGLTIDLVFLLRRVPTDAVLGMLGYFCFGQELVAPHLHHDITDTTIIQKPTDAILMGQQDYEFTDKTWDVRPMDVKVEVTVTTDGVKNISGVEPTFTTKTGNKGYD